MIILTAALAATATPLEPVAPERQARAVVRILKAEPLRFAELEKLKPQLFRETTIRSPNGTEEKARLIEFE